MKNSFHPKYFPFIKEEYEHYLVQNAEENMERYAELLFSGKIKNNRVSIHQNHTFEIVSPPLVYKITIYKFFNFYYLGIGITKILFTHIIKCQ